MPPAAVVAAAPPPSPSSSTVSLLPHSNNNKTKKAKKRWGVLNVFTPVPPAVLQQQRTLEETMLKGSDDDVCDCINATPSYCNEKHHFGGNIGRQYPLVIVCSRRGKLQLSLKTVRAVYEANPNAVIDGDVLHHAIEKRAPPNIIRFLVSKHPDGAGAQQRGWLPLHKACAATSHNNVSSSYSKSVIEYLIECYPEGLRQRACQKDGLPLHIAVRHGAPLDVVQLLVTKYRSALKLADYETDNIETVRGWYHYNTGGTQQQHNNFLCNNGGLPLHLACRDRPKSMALIRYLILQYPDALKSKNHHGWLPLHFACFAGSTIPIIKMIVDCCPLAVMERTVNHRWPVDVCLSQRNPDLAVIQYMISRHPTATTGKEPNQHLFFHYCDEAAAVFAAWRVAEFLGVVAQRAGEGYTFVYPRET